MGIRYDFHKIHTMTYAINYYKTKAKTRRSSEMKFITQFKLLDIKELEIRNFHCLKQELENITEGKSKGSLT